MLSSCEDDIKNITTKIYEIENYDQTIKKRKEQLKNTVGIMDEIISEGVISDANLRILIEKIVIFERAEGLDITIKLQADFTEHMRIFDEEGSQQADLEVIREIVPVAMRRKRQKSNKNNWL